MGPELAFADAFVSYKERVLRGSSLKSDALILVEPLIDSGYPDIVLMLYSDDFMENWSPERTRIKDVDLKVLSYVNTVKTADKSQMATMLGFNAKRIRSSVDLLYECRMINVSRNTVRQTRKADYFGLRRIVAFEAKASGVQSAIEQAVRNTRYANESYVLLQSNKPTNLTLRKCRTANVGLISGETFCTQVRPERRPLPNSYVTLKLNEWLGMRLAEGIV